MLTLISSVIFCFFMKASIYKCQCIIETLHDAEFSISVTRHLTVESGHCIVIPYEFTYPTNKVTIPFETIWFEGDPHKYLKETPATNFESKGKATLNLNGLPQGEYEYGFKLEWGCNQTYTFPERVRISVSALMVRPNVRVPLLTAGRSAKLSCFSSTLCSGPTSVYWKWTKANGHTEFLHGVYRKLTGNAVNFTPKADDHNTNITCVAVYEYDVVETTVTLAVNSHPTLLNGSQCTVDGKRLTCVCISQGIPLTPITWPLDSLTDYTVTSSKGIRTVKSTFTTSPTEHRHTSIKCISANELGRVEVELPVQNHTVDSRLAYWSSWRMKFEENLPWLTAGLSMSLNLALLCGLIICACKRRNSRQRKSHEEERHYVSLNKTDDGEEYSVISPQPRYEFMS